MNNGVVKDNQLANKYMKEELEGMVKNDLVDLVLDYQNCWTKISLNSAHYIRLKLKDWKFK